jgi:hypothetical protein
VTTVHYVVSFFCMGVKLDLSKNGEKHRLQVFDVQVRWTYLDSR